MDSILLNGSRNMELPEDLQFFNKYQNDIDMLIATASNSAQLTALDTAGESLCHRIRKAKEGIRNRIQNIRAPQIKMSERLETAKKESFKIEEAVKEDSQRLSLKQGEHELLEKKVLQEEQVLMRYSNFNSENYLRNIEQYKEAIRQEKKTIH